MTSGTAPAAPLPLEGPWALAALTAAIFAVDAAGLGGVVLRSPAGPARDRWLALLRAGLPAEAPMRRIPAAIPDGRLLGGLDLAATLRAGRPVAEGGLLAECNGGVVLLAMAERLTSTTAARIGTVLDTGEIVAARDGVDLRAPARLGAVALDEGMAEDECPPAALLDRMAFLLDLAAIGPRETLPERYSSTEIAGARAALPGVDADDAAIEALCGTALALGIASIRAPILALRVARIAAALAGRVSVLADDVALAASLVLAPRATRLPAPPAEAEATDDRPSEDPADTPPPDPDPAPETERRDEDRALEDLVLAAAQAAIPANLLAQLGCPGDAGRARSAGRSGAMQKTGNRGRPAGVRPGEPNGGRRLDVVETLRAAAPWQRLRRDVAPVSVDRRILIRREDFRVTHREQRTETTIIFVVDASRSSAVNRLAEAKGAVEMLLADCYVRRDQVAVLAFRGREAQLLLPPTRSLVRAKRQLAGLPGGGGTPMAAGLDAALRLADAVRRRGQTPTIVLLTDGRANIARDGGAGREKAEADARAAGRQIRRAGVTSLLVDTAPRPQPQAAAFAAEMGARYLPLPYANAARLSTAVRATAEPIRRL